MCEALTQILPITNEQRTFEFNSGTCVVSNIIGQNSIAGNDGVLVLTVQNNPNAQFFIFYTIPSNEGLPMITDANGRGGAVIVPGSLVREGPVLRVSFTYGSVSQFLYAVSIPISRLNFQEAAVEIQPSVLSTLLSSQTIDSMFNDCQHPYLYITAQVDNQFIMDVTYAAFRVGDCMEHECDQNCMFGGYVKKVNEVETIFYVRNCNPARGLKLGSVMIGEGSFTDKIGRLDLGRKFLEYILLKFILGRLLFGKFNLKYLLRKYYDRLINAVRNSVYANALPFLLQHEDFEHFFR